MMDNVTVTPMFFLSGLNESKNSRVVLFSLSLLCYCTILLANISVITIIILDENLHEPMYIILCVFCMNGLYGATGFFPKFLWDLLSPLHAISYSACLIQTLVIYSFVCCDLSILAVMAYDRYLAICRPLIYHSLMSKPRLTVLLCFSWITPFSIIGTNIYLTSRLKLCSSYIGRLFCVNWAIVKLACYKTQTAVNNIFAYFTITIYVLHGFYIVWSYMYLIKTCVNSIENRAKFMQTCVPHLISLLIFLMTVLSDIMHIRYGLSNIPQTLENFIAIEFLVIPPLMNPLIYGFKLTKIRKRIMYFFKCKSK